MGISSNFLLIFGDAKVTDICSLHDPRSFSPDFSKIVFFLTFPLQHKFRHFPVLPDRREPCLGLRIMRCRRLPCTTCATTRCYASRYWTRSASATCAMTQARSGVKRTTSAATTDTPSSAPCIYSAQDSCVQFLAASVSLQVRNLKQEV